MRLIPRMGFALLIGPGCWLQGRRFMAAAGSRCRLRPTVKAIPVTDNYFGTKIVDNYRWLENANSPETKAFIDAENALHRALHAAGADSAADQPTIWTHWST